MTCKIEHEGGAGLVPAHSIAHVVGTYNDAVTKIREALRTIAEQHNRIESVLGPDSYVYLETRHLRFTEPEGELRQMDRRAWRRIIDKSGVRRVLSVKAAEELDKQLEREELPAITEQTVGDMLRGMADRGPEYLAAAVKEVHEFLRPPSSRYKTNTEFDIGEKVILSGWVVRQWSGGRFQVNHYMTAKPRALDNVFALLDGKPPITTHSGWLADAIYKSEDGKGETEYFRFKACKNHNLHLEFKRPDLVAKLNAIAGGRNLYAAGGAK